MSVTSRNYRHADPHTSKEAAQKLDASSMLLSLLTAFADAYPGGLTAEEAANICGIDRYAASKRVSDLKRLKSIKPMGDIVRRGSSGRMQAVHIITRLGQLDIDEAEAK